MTAEIFLNTHKKRILQLVEKIRESSEHKGCLTRIFDGGDSMASESERLSHPFFLTPDQSWRKFFERFGDATDSKKKGMCLQVIAERLLLFFDVSIENRNVEYQLKKEVEKWLSDEKLADILEDISLESLFFVALKSALGSEITSYFTKLYEKLAQEEKELNLQEAQRLFKDFNISIGKLKNGRFIPSSKISRRELSKSSNLALESMIPIYFLEKEKSFFQLDNLSQYLHTTFTFLKRNLQYIFLFCNPEKFKVTRPLSYFFDTDIDTLSFWDLYFKLDREDQDKLVIALVFSKIQEYIDFYQSKHSLRPHIQAWITQNTASTDADKINLEILPKAFYSLLIDSFSIGYRVADKLIHCINVRKITSFADLNNEEKRYLEQLLTFLGIELNLQQKLDSKCILDIRQIWQIEHKYGILTNIDGSKNFILYLCLLVQKITISIPNSPFERNTLEFLSLSAAEIQQANKKATQIAITLETCILELLKKISSEIEAFLPPSILSALSGNSHNNGPQLELILKELSLSDDEQNKYAALITILTFVNKCIVDIQNSSHIYPGTHILSLLNIKGRLYSELQEKEDVVGRPTRRRSSFFNSKPADTASVFREIQAYFKQSSQQIAQEIEQHKVVLDIARITL